MIYPYNVHLRLPAMTMYFVHKHVYGSKIDKTPFPHT